jgi:hypothetical protein
MKARFAGHDAAAIADLDNAVSLFETLWQVPVALG